MNTATISFRVAPETKRRARALFSRLGVTTSDAFASVEEMFAALDAAPDDE